MSSFFQLFLAWGLLLVFVLVLYIVDKVNVIYQGYAKPDLPQTYNDGLFGELVGKTLWDAMSGIPIPGVDTKFVSSLKPHYEPVLRQHIEQVFMEGYSHGKAGTAGVPTNNRIIPTPRGSIESWLPMHHLASIYQAGVDFAAKKPEDVLRIQQSLDQVTAMIYARIGVGLTEAYSATLLIHPEGEEEDGKDLPPPETDDTPATAQLTHQDQAQVLQPDLSGLQQTPEFNAPVRMAEEAKPMPA
ncbi:MAG: hypothetical protein RLZZ470_438 [Pseudomonadota bacterium]|jgi:hypothetical protein